MYKASNNYISASNDLTRNSKTKIVLDEITYDGSKYIKTYPKFSHENETMIGGFPIKSCSFEFWAKDEYIDFANKEFTVYKGLLIGNTVEWIPQGIFKAAPEDIESSDSGEYLTITGYDRAKDMGTILYEDTETYPCNSLNFITNALSKYGYELENEDFPHTDTITQKPNFLEKTYLRDVVSRYAEMRGCIALFSRNGKVEIKKPTETGLKYYFYQYEKLTKEKIFGPIDMVILGRKNTNNDITYPSTETLPNPQFEWKIEDNPFLDLIREQVVEQVFNDITTLSVVPFTTTNLLDNFLLDLNDIIEIQTKDGNWFKTTVLSIDTENRIRCTIKAPIQNKMVSNYSLAGSVKEELREVRLDVDHNSQRIDIIASQTTESTEKVANMEITVEGISSQVSSTKEQVDSSIEQITNAVENIQTSTQQQINVIQNTLENGVPKVSTTSGTFDMEGLHISKSDEAMSLLADWDGFVVKRDQTEVLTVRSSGVNTENLTVRNYLTVAPIRMEKTTAMSDPSAVGLGFFYNGGA